jgi:hypothetical protein
MTSFDRREEAFEAKFAHDQELTFKARARALRMLGLWAAGKRGETGTAAEEYAHALIDADVSTTPPGDQPDFQGESPCQGRIHGPRPEARSPQYHLPHPFAGGRRR